MGRVICFATACNSSTVSGLVKDTALRLYEEGKSVLVIDGNLECPTLSDTFHAGGLLADGWERRQGFMNFLREINSDTREDLSLTGEGKLIPRIARRFRIDADRGDPSTDIQGFQDSFLQSTMPGLPQDAIGIDMPEDGAGIWFVGAGCSYSDELKSVEHFAKYFDFDWSGFLRRSGPEILECMSTAFTDQNTAYDYILMQTGSGYNLPVVLFMQYFASHIVYVTDVNESDMSEHEQVMARVFADGKMRARGETDLQICNINNQNFEAWYRNMVDGMPPGKPAFLQKRLFPDKGPWPGDTYPIDMC